VKSEGEGAAPLLHSSPVTCHLSPVTCHLSPHLSPLTCHLSRHFFNLSVQQRVHLLDQLVRPERLLQKRLIGAYQASPNHVGSGKEAAGCAGALAARARPRLDIAGRAPGIP
jgi:hypothetical protein